MSDTNERSVASRGSQPVAWAVMQPDSYSVYASRMRAEKRQELCAGGEIVPLYRQPQPTLTDEERAALEYGIRQADEYDRVGIEDAKRAAIVFRGLLKRLG